MHNNQIFLLIFVCIFSMLLCCSESDDPPVDDEPIDNPIFVVGDYNITFDRGNESYITYFNTFEIDREVKDGAYYMDIWTRIDKQDEGYPNGFPEYNITINKILYEPSFKTKTVGWQSVSLVNTKQVAATVQLNKEKNSIVIIGKNYIPKVELIKFYQNQENAGISDVDLKLIFSFTGSTYPESFITPKPQPDFIEATFTEDELIQIETLIELIPNRIKKDFEEKYIEWKDTWSRPSGSGSHTRDYAQSDEYKSLLNYCEQYGKSMWVLIFEKMSQKEIFSINLLEDLSFPEFRKIYDDIEAVYRSKGDWPVLSMMIEYSKILLEVEYDNMLKAIQDLPEMKNETLEPNTVLLNNSMTINDE